MTNPDKQKFGGRKPGAKNKTTVAVKAALEEAFDKLGGVEALVEWGKSNRGEFYKLWSRLLPKKIEADVDVNSNGNVVIYFPDDGRDSTIDKDSLPRESDLPALRESET